MSTLHLGSPRHSSKQRSNQREGRKGFHGTPGKVRDSESVSTPQALQGCPAASVLCCKMCIVNHPVLGWVTFADPSTWDPLGELWPQGSDTAIATGLGPSFSRAGSLQLSWGAPCRAGPAVQVQGRVACPPAGPLPLPDFVHVIMRRS